MSESARLVNSNKVPALHEGSNNLDMRKLVSNELDGPEISMTIVEIDGKHRMLRTDASTRVYYILDGNFLFDFKDAKSMNATTGEVVVIYKSTFYQFVGKGKYLVINSPAFRDGDDIYFDESSSEK